MVVLLIGRIPMLDQIFSHFITFTTVKYKLILFRFLQLSPKPISWLYKQLHSFYSQLNMCSVTVILLAHSPGYLVRRGDLYETRVTACVRFRVLVVYEDS